MGRIVQGIVAVSIVAFLVSGCANMTAQQNGFLRGAAIGGAVGAGGGAYQGHQVDGSNRDRGAVIGAVAGALVGGLIGAAMAKEEVPPPPEPEPAPMPEEVVEPEPEPVPETVVEPEPEPVPPPVREKIILRGINFDFDKSAVKPEFEPILDEAARILEAHPDVSVVVEGHTCWIGTAKYNQGLSERRARSVQKYLVNQGVAATRMTAIGHGETQPIADNGTEEGRRVNRRVEFKILE